MSRHISRKKTRSGCLKFDDLNLGLSETVEILQVTAQSFDKPEITVFWNSENSLHYYTMFPINHPRINLSHHATTPSTFLPTQIFL